MASTSCGAERQEDRAGGIDVVGGLAEADAERDAALVAGFGRLQERVERPVVGLRFGACRIHRLHVDAGVLLHQIDARAGALDLAADAGGNAEPFAACLAQIFRGAVDFAVLGDDRPHDVVDVFQLFGIGVGPPCRHRKDVVTGLCLRFGGDGQQVLVTLARDVVDRDLDLLLLGPFIDQIGGGLVGAGHPVVPETDREFAGGVGAAHIGRGDRGPRMTAQ